MPAGDLNHLGLDQEQLDQGVIIWLFLQKPHLETRGMYSSLGIKKRPKAFSLGSQGESVQKDSGASQL